MIAQRGKQLEVATMGFPSWKRWVMGLGLAAVAAGMTAQAQQTLRPGARRPSATPGFVFNTPFGQHTPTSSHPSERSDIGIKPYELEPRGPRVAHLGYSEFPQAPTLPQQPANFQNSAPQHMTARFGLGGVPDRNEQLASMQVGVARNNSLQQQLAVTSRPYFGLGFGWGGGW